MQVVLFLVVGWLLWLMFFSKKGVSQSSDVANYQGSDVPSELDALAAGTVAPITGNELDQLENPPGYSVDYGTDIPVPLKGPRNS